MTMEKDPTINCSFKQQTGDDKTTKRRGVNGLNQLMKSTNEPTSRVFQEKGERGGYLQVKGKKQG